MALPTLGLRSDDVWTQNQEPNCVSGYCLPPDYEKLEKPDGKSSILVREIMPNMIFGQVKLLSFFIQVDLTVMDILAVDDNDFSVSIYAYLGFR